MANESLLTLQIATANLGRYSEVSGLICYAQLILTYIRTYFRF